MTIGGTSIKRGDQVLVALSSANRDEAEFRGADMLELARSPTWRKGVFLRGLHALPVST